MKRKWYFIKENTQTFWPSGALSKTSKIGKVSLSLEYFDHPQFPLPHEQNWMDWNEMKQIRKEANFGFSSGGIWSVHKYPLIMEFWRKALAPS